jgi:hypothetical protein
VQEQQQGWQGVGITVAGDVIMCATRVRGRCSVTPRGGGSCSGAIAGLAGHGHQGHRRHHDVTTRENRVGLGGACVLAGLGVSALRQEAAQGLVRMPSQTGLPCRYYCSTLPHCVWQVALIGPLGCDERHRGSPSRHPAAVLHACANRPPLGCATSRLTAACCVMFCRLPATIPQLLRCLAVHTLFWPQPPPLPD